METTKNNGQVKVTSAVQANKKAPQFVAGNPVNKVSQKEAPISGVDTAKPTAEVVQVQQSPVVIAQVPQVKPALNLEETLKLVAELAKKTSLRDKYTGYIDDLSAFVIAQNDEDDMAKDAVNFKSCELVIMDGKGQDFRTTSATVIAGIVNFMTSRFSERLAEVEAEIVLPS